MNQFSDKDLAEFLYRAVMHYIDRLSDDIDPTGWNHAL